MKKVFLFAAVITAFSFASCKKDYTCTCTSTAASGAAGITTSTTIHDTKSKATTACNNLTTASAGFETCAVK